MVNEVNNEFPGHMHTFQSIDTVADLDTTTMYLTKFLNYLSPSGLPEHELKLKDTTVVILLRSMDINAGNCNGT